MGGAAEIRTNFFWKAGLKLLILGSGSLLPYFGVQSHPSWIWAFAFFLPFFVYSFQPGPAGELAGPTCPVTPPPREDPPSIFFLQLLFPAGWLESPGVLKVKSCIMLSCFWASWAIFGHFWSSVLGQSWRFPTLHECQQRFPKLPSAGQHCILSHNYSKENV